MRQHGRRGRWTARLAALATVTLAANVLSTVAAVATPARPAGLHAPDPRPVHSCATPGKADEAMCFAMYVPGITQPDVTGHGSTLPASLGYGPAQLQSAYDLPSATRGIGQTVAVVDAQDDPNAESDLAVYRSQFGLPPCTTANGCFRKVDQTGGADYPRPDSRWSEEISLDLDMVSAACPACHILLVEANSAAISNLAAAEDTAVAMGAKFVSNSYGTDYTAKPSSGESSADLQTNAFYDHPGVAIVASAGDERYGVAYPAASPYVTAVGGTSLVRAPSTARGWRESVWSETHGATGSGCSVIEPKPLFQHDTGCTHRTVADVSAVADPTTGVAVYDSYLFAGWGKFGGTSAASPIIASAYALAGKPLANSAPNSFPYADPAALNDVTTGYTDACTPGYLCHARKGYDGPTGLGTPHGIAAFSGAAHGYITGQITRNGTGEPLAGPTCRSTGRSRPMR
ncbi:MAG TPA: S53 family peptidase [Streptosporangiaceae bacterium]